jgi:hypothetical protein
MSTQVQFRRGTTAEHTSFAGAVGEVTVDTTKNVTVVHNGSQTGGYPLLREDGVNSLLSPGSLASCALKFANAVNTGLYSPGAKQVALVTDGVARLTIDGSGSASFQGNLTVQGSLTVNGDTTSGDVLALIIALS